jgi:hypothetical protein
MSPGLQEAASKRMTRGRGRRDGQFRQAEGERTGSIVHIGGERRGASQMPTGSVLTAAYRKREPGDTMKACEPLHTT